MIREFNPNVASFLVDCGIYDLSSHKQNSPKFNDTDDGFLEDLVFAKVHEPMYSRALKRSIDINFVPDTGTCKGIIYGVWTLYLRTPRIRRINSQITTEVDSEIDENRRSFMNNFGMVTAKTILKLLPKTFVHTRSIFFNAVGASRFLTTDHPSIPSLYDERTGNIQPCNEYDLQRSVILADEWPHEVALLCPVSPSWCMLTRNVNDISSVHCVSIDSILTERLNQVIRANADRFVILPPSRK